MDPTAPSWPVANAFKVFPLPSAVLFPHAMLPLHIFEPRYRALVHDALVEDKLMGLAQLQPGWEPQYDQRPPMLPILCTASIVWHEELPGGRYNILLQGICRARILDERPPAKEYREVRLEPLVDPPYVGPEEELLRQAILELAAHLPAPFAQGLLPVVARVTGGPLADVIASAVVTSAARRYALLSELDVPRRMSRVLNEVTDLLAHLNPGAPSGPLN